DPYAKSTTDNFVLLTERKKSPVRLIMGPWTHGGRSLTYSGNIDFGLQSSVEGNLDIDYNHLRLRFFDNHLKDDRPAQHTMPAVTLFVMGGGSGTKNATGRLDHGGYWREENEWPLLRAINTKYFIHESTLTTTIPESGADGITYLYDPNNPVPTIGGNISSGLPIMEPGGFNQIENPEFYGSSKPYLPLSSRPDVLTFQTHILEQAIEVTGPIKSVLWISSEAIDTDFTAKLIDVYPPSVDYPEGYALNITDGIIRTKFRNSWDKPELMHSGELYQVTIELYPTSNLFVKGHRIRLDISSSNFPRLDVNGNTGNNPGLDPVKIPTRNTIYQDKDHPSYIELPIIPT
ncbi:MAG: CocE/NonD family hydrolase, partial [SAR202 cluster bacterium]